MDDDLINSQAPIGDLAVLIAEVRYGVREEMAQKLGDVVLRRGELGTAGMPEDFQLSACAETIGEELGWSLTQVQAELQEMKALFERRLSIKSASISSST